MGQTSKALVLLLGTVLAGVGESASFSRCDINQDANTNVVDVEDLMDEVLGKGAAIDDLNGDGVVTVADVQLDVIAALGLGCIAGPYTHAVGSVPISIENSAPPVPAGPQTYATNGLPFSMLNSVSPVTPGPMTFAANSLPFSILNSASPVSPAPQTYYVSGLRFSIFNGLESSSLQSLRVAPSLRFLRPVDPAFLAAALIRGAQTVNGKAGCLDSDGDGLCDADELIIGTSPYLADTDGDGYPDGLELALGSDPLDPKSIPDIRPQGYYATPPVSLHVMIPVASLTSRRQGDINADNYR